MDQKGSVLGGTLLLAGCSIGAGMLGIPAVAALAGFLPSALLSTLCWIYMCTTGLLLLEVNLSFRGEVSLVSMAERYLGRIGKGLTWALFLYLFYSLLIAYVSGTGALMTDFAKDFFGMALSPVVGIIPVLLFFAALIFLGTFFVDECNRILMLGLLATFLALVFFGAPKVDLSLLRRIDFSETGPVLSVMVIMFGFHNLIPTLTTYMHHDEKKLRKTVILGSFIPLLIYILWEALILGLVPIEGNPDVAKALQDGGMATRVLRAAVGKEFITDLTQSFAFFAIMTSLLSVSLSFVDFLADGLHVKKDVRGKLLLITLVLVPPFLCSLVSPHLFLTALQYAGAFGAVTLFGILPALAVYVKRERMGDRRYQLVPGGQATLLAVILFSCLVMGLLIKQELQL